jgi:hypothetical protein
MFSQIGDPSLPGFYAVLTGKHLLAVLYLPVNTAEKPKKFAFPKTGL